VVPITKPTLSSESVNRLVVRACRLLARREYSAHELRRKFVGRAEPGDCEAMLDRLIEQGAQSDRRFAEMLCRSRYESGKGPIRLQHEFRNHRIDERLAQAALAPYEGKWAEAAERARIRKFGKSLPDNAKEWARQLNFLRQRGFGESELSQYETTFR